MLFTREQITGLYYLSVGVLLLFIFPMILGSAKEEVILKNDNFYRVDSLLPDSLFVAPTQAEIMRAKNPPIKIRKVREQGVVELNRADSAELVSLKGIGGYYASKILDYRSKLGGYFDIRQLRELNLTYFNLDSMSRYLRADTSLIVKRYIGDYTFKNLLRHPYLDYETLVLIFDYKRELTEGDTLTIKKLSAAGVIRSTQAKKLSYYFY